MSVDNTPGDIIRATAFGFGAVAPPPHCMDAIRTKIAAGVYHTPIIADRVARAILQSGDLAGTFQR